MTPKPSLAKRMGISERHLKNLLSGRTRVPFARAEQIARLTGTDLKTMALANSKPRKNRTHK